MPYPYGMQSAPAVGSGLGGLPRRQQAETREPLIIEYLSRLRYTASAFTYEIPAGYSKARITLVSRGGDYLGSSTFGGGKAISPVIPVKAGVKVEISFGAAVAQTATPPASSTVTCGEFTMTALTPSISREGPPAAVSRISLAPRLARVVSVALAAVQRWAPFLHRREATSRPAQALALRAPT